MAVSKSQKVFFRSAGEEAKSASLKAARKAVAFTGSMKALSPKETLFRAGGLTKYLYKVEFGCIFTYSTFDTGRRRIWAFYLPGDYFGLEIGERHTRSAQATTYSTVRVIRNEKLQTLAVRDIAVAKRLLDITASELQRTRNHVLLLHKRSLERVAEFLIELKKRTKSRKEFDLPMFQLEIADYLNLTKETVSRALKRMEKMSVISSRPNRRIMVHGGKHFLPKGQRPRGKRR